MFRLELLQNQWLVLALIGGSALALLTILWYMAYWRPLEGKGAEQHGVSVPAILIVVYVAIAFVAAGYVAARILYPPNW